MRYYNLPFKNWHSRLISVYVSYSIWCGVNENMSALLIHDPRQQMHLNWLTILCVQLPRAACSCLVCCDSLCTWWTYCYSDFLKIMGLPAIVLQSLLVRIDDFESYILVKHNKMYTCLIDCLARKKGFALTVWKIFPKTNYNTYVYASTYSSAWKWVTMYPCYTYSS